jgi:hypothetical protein
LQVECETRVVTVASFFLKKQAAAAEEMVGARLMRVLEELQDAGAQLAVERRAREAAEAEVRVASPIPSS